MLCRWSFRLKNGARLNTRRINIWHAGHRCTARGEPPGARRDGYLACRCFCLQQYHRYTRCGRLRARSENGAACYAELNGVIGSGDKRPVLVEYRCIDECDISSVGQERQTGSIDLNGYLAGGPRGTYFVSRFDRSPDSSLSTEGSWLIAHGAESEWRMEKTVYR